jgi:hypothetical protein
MLNPFWVASARGDAWLPLAAENHARYLCVEEGRTRPSKVMARYSHHFDSLTRPKTAKPASSQGEALALDISEQTSFKTNLKDMILELHS